MKVLIIYATKGGASLEAAKMLAERMGSFAEVDLHEISSAPSSLEDYDVAVVGGSIRMNKLDKRLKGYIKEHAETLSQMHSAAFICCGITNDFEDYVATEIPKGVKFSLGAHCFGGQLKPDRAKGFDKAVIFMMRQSILSQDPDKSDTDRRELPELFPDTIYALAEKIKQIKMI